ncbi:MAG TPA: hypothetical protein PK867_25770, partial [Pirellulales bacterium]|nr:hypothetical protein [Pirellulales bacterium]
RPSSEDDLGRSPHAYSQSARRWFLPVKNNLAADADVPGRSFELVDGRIRWHTDDPAPELAEALLPSAHNTDRRRVRNAAMAWLKEALAAGPMPSDELYQQGIKNGFSKGTLLRAAAELGIHSHKTGFNGGWEMRWVPPEAAGPGSMLRARPLGFRVVGEGERERRSDGATERGREELGVASCASSMEREELATGSCASSREREELATASCASSREREELEAASCASSNYGGPAQDQHHAARGTTPPHPLPEGSGSPRPDKPPNAHEVVVDALREAC